LTVGSGSSLGTGPLTVNGGTLNLNNSAQTFSSLTGSGDVSLGSGQVLTVATASGSDSYSGSLDGAGALIKSGNGTLVLTSSNAYTGPTTVSAGKLVVNGELTGSSAVTVTGGILGGGGIISSSVTINSGGTISPGNSPGTMTTGNEDWNTGGNYVWEINKADGTQGADPGWDFLDIGGTLTINSTPGNPFVIKITSLTLGNTAGLAAGFVRFQPYTFTIATADNPIVNFSADKFLIDTSAFFNDPTNIGGFAIVQSLDGLSLNLTYTAIPEPGTWAAGAFLVLLALARRRRA
ncbi:MAG: autotransporter-associated beta strand repeat-containing protein, partial [Mycobacterium sp.]